MLLQEKIGHVDSFRVNNQAMDWLPLEWYETTKRILRKQTVHGREVSLKFLNENPALTEGDILYADENTVIAVTVLSCNCIVIKPANMLEMASVSYEIGNKHLPLFFDGEELLVPFEMPLFNLLVVQGYAIQQQQRKLLKQLKTTVAPHPVGIGNNVFSKILTLTTPAE